SRQLDTILKPATERRLDSSREPGDDGVCAAARDGPRDARVLLEVLDAPHADVLAELQLVLIEVLEDHAEPREKLAPVPRTEVFAVEQHPALGRLVEAGDEL